MGPLRTTGRGIGVAVLDSGISPHPDLDDRLACAVSTVPNSPGTGDFLGHGTHVASLALGNGAVSRGEYCGVAPEAHLISVRVTSGEEAQMTPEERYGAVVQGLRWAIENRQRYNIRVVNLSMGYPLAQSKDSLIDPLGKAIREATKAGLILVVAAGNDGDRPGSLCKTPATHPDVITVGSSDGDRVADFSSRGPGPGKGMPDLLAPGIDLMGANVAFSLAESRNDRELNPKPTAHFMPNGHPGYLAMQGTSMSAPLVAGVIACMLEANPFLGPQEVKDILKRTACRLEGWNEYAQGAGLMNADAAIAEAVRLAPRP